MALTSQDLVPAAKIPEAARAWGVSPATVRRLIEAGRVRAVRIGESVRIPADEIARVLANGTDR